MTLQQLLENAHLEALGYLDEREQAAFEAAFTAAPPAVREQVRAEQARVAPMEQLLPAVEPPEHLRARVLSAVSAAMLAEQATRGVVGLSGGMGLVPATRVHRAWRAASIGLVTAVVILSGAFVHVYTTNNSINKRFEEDAAGTAFLQTFNREYMMDVLYNTSTARVVFAPTDPASPAKAAVWVSPDWKTSRMFCQMSRLDDGRVYRVVTLDDNNQVATTLKEFEGDGQSKVFEVVHLASGTRVAIISVGAKELSSQGDRVMEALV